MQYTVHFACGRNYAWQREVVEAKTATEAIDKAKAQFSDFQKLGYRVVRVDHTDDAGRIVIDGA